MPESPSSPLDQWIAATDRALRTLAGSIGRSDLSAFTFSSRTAVDDTLAGGSIAMIASSCSIWF